MTCAGDEDDDAILLEVPNGPAQDEGFGNILHFDRGLDARDDTALLELALQRETVDHGGEHSHVVRRGAIHSAMTGRESAPDVAAADDD